MVMMNPYRWLSGQDSDEQELGLTEYVLPYINHLKSEYMTLITTLSQPDDLRTKEAMELARKIIAKSEKDLRWGDVHTLESVILRLQPLDVVKRRAWSLRDRYHAAVGDEVFMAYERSHPPDPADPNLAEAELRDDLELVLSDFHWMYAINPLREYARSRIIQVVFRQICVFSLITSLFVLFDLIAAYRGYHPFASLFPLILLTGAFGAFISLIQRVQSIPSAGDTILNVLNIKSGRTGFLLAPLSGALFALLAYLLFVSGFVKGDLFPSILYSSEVTNVDNINKDFDFYVYGMMPRSPTDFAKLLIWCFIAGFAERLLPDALNRLIARKLEGYVERMVAVPALPPLGGEAGADAEAARKREADEKAAAVAAAAARKEEADKEAADEKAAAIASAAARKEQSEKAAADKVVGADEQDVAEAQKRAAEEHALADTEAARRVAEAEKRAAEEHALADTEAARRVAEAEKRSADVHSKPVQPEEPAKGAPPAQSPEPTKPVTVPSGPKPKDTLDPPTSSPAP
jgi:hypothetical protein